MGAREREQLLNERVLDARALIELAIPDKLVTKDPDGEIGGKRFTKAFERFLSSPPLIMQVLRERRFSRKHWELHWRRGRDDRDRQWQVPWVACGCVERLGYRIVKGIVLERRTIQDLAHELDLTVEVAT